VCVSLGVSILKTRQQGRGKLWVKERGVWLPLEHLGEHVAAGRQFGRGEADRWALNASSRAWMMERLGRQVGSA
jgi:hypothetical protein